MVSNTSGSHSYSLKFLFVDVNTSIEAAFSTPNLAHFSYEGDAHSKFSMNAPNLLEAKRNLWSYRFNSDAKWYSHLVLFFSHPYVVLEEIEPVCLLGKGNQ